MSDSERRDRILAFLGELVAFPTAYPPGHSTGICAYLAKRFAQMGYETSLHTKVPGMDNVVARMGSGEPSLVLNVHIDTVDAGDPRLWETPPYEATVRGDSVFGLGAANCKGSGAVQLWLAEEIARRGGPARGEIVFTFVTDEESLGPNGMAFLRDEGIVKPNMLLLGAPTDNAMVISERGVLWVEVTTAGRAAHAGQPEDGDSAILRMLRVLSRCDVEMERRLAGRRRGDMQSTINIGTLSGGRNANVVPSSCSAVIDRRLLPGETVDDAFAELEEILCGGDEPSGSVHVERLRGTNGFEGDVEGEMLKALSSAIESVTGSAAAVGGAIGVSDGRYFADDGIEIVNFGPGVGSEGHSVNESVTFESLETSARVLERLVGDLLGFERE
jgi:acetylornithine deacetylase/succinyl-diaminopimelate desuccinylase family protein